MKKIIILAMLLFPVSSFSQDIGNYLVTNDIGGYKFRPKPTKRIYGNSGVLLSTGHFYVDHDDVTYETEYILPSPLLGVEVKVTKHAGSDSDKWLLHEVDREFRNYYGIPGKSYGPRQISGQTIIENLVAGGSYRWISGAKVIVIEYHDSQMTKPEPIEVIQTYLQKHPSTMQAFTLEDLRSNANKTNWIKDEMDRRLWLCDKWFMQLQLQKVQQTDAFQAAVRSMNIFLDYREKYYGLKAADEKNLLAGYLSNNNGTSIKAKLTEYKIWWSANKDKAISL